MFEGPPGAPEGKLEHETYTELQEALDAEERILTELRNLLRPENDRNTQSSRFDVLATRMTESQARVAAAYDAWCRVAANDADL